MQKRISSAKLVALCMTLVAAVSASNACAATVVETFTDVVGSTWSTGTTPGTATSKLVSFNATTGSTITFDITMTSTDGNLMNCCGGAGVVYIGTGVVSGNDILRANEIIYHSEEDIKKAMFYLDDWTEATSTSITVAELHRAVHQDMAAARINPNIVVATVCGEDLFFGMARMWEALGDELPWQTLTTRSLIEAKEWIKNRTGIEVI